MSDARWPTLQHDRAQATRATLHLWTQIAGKTRLALAPRQNHWWEVALYVTARGLGTSAIPWGDQVLELELDLTEHVLALRSSSGQTLRMPLAARPIADFFREFLAALDAFGVHPAFLRRPVEVRESVPFEEDTRPRTYDPEWAHTLWRVLVLLRNVFERFRAGFLGKASPVHFFWGSFDLAVTRFSGRRAPLHPGGAPHCADWVMQEAYSHEVSSAGFWAGDELFPEPILYSYAYPQPAGFAAAAVKPAAARWDAALREFVLPYEKLRLLEAPEDRLLDFLHTTYATAATLGRWDRAALERIPL